MNPGETSVVSDLHVYLLLDQGQWDTVKMKSLVSCKPTLHLSDFIFSSIEPFLCYVYKYSNYRLNTVAFVSGVSPPCLVDKKMTTRGSSTG